jgi:glycosyltransferase involved in cell wall biosynthesis
MTESSPASSSASAGARLPSLSVVVPVFNGESWIEPTATRVVDALQAADWPGVELVFVDDGSTDGTAAAVEALDLGLPVRLVRQENKGRFLARKAGIEAAVGESVFFLDVRVFTDPQAFVNLAQQLREHPERRVWNGHVDIEVKGNPFARFWQAVTFTAWRRYLANPRLVSFGADDFDYYPKGTTCFLAPRQLLLDAYREFSTYYDDLRRVNDDTSLIRTLAEREPVYLGPEFAFTYFARDSLSGFMRHAFYRGIHFIDGYLRPGTRYFWPLVAVLAATPVGIVLAVVKPLLVLALGLLGVAAAAAAMLALRTPPAAALWFAALLPFFAAVYGAGLWRGVFLAVRTRVRKGGGR